MGSEEICTEGAVETCILQKQLEKYASQDLYPLHMPGHKRRVQPAPGLPYDWDVTEVPGTDDLHDAHGILEGRPPCTGRTGPGIWWAGAPAACWRGSGL